MPKIKPKKAKKRVTKPEDFERYADAYYSIYKNKLKDNPTDETFDKTLSSYANDESILNNKELYDKIKERVEKKLGYPLAPTPSREKKEVKKSREFSYITYINNQQVFSDRQYITVKNKRITIYRDKKGRFASLKKK